MAAFSNFFKFEADSELLSGIGRKKTRLLAVEAGRLCFLVAILVTTFLFQVRQPTFLSTEILYPLYIIILASFLLNLGYLLLFEKYMKYWPLTAVLFIFDAFFITGLIYFTGVVQSIFIFLYLVNIIFCGFIFQKQGAILLALLTSTLFSFLLVLRPDLNGEVIFFSVALNNLGFFSVAILSGYLSEQLQFMGTELVARRKVIQELQDLNRYIVENVSSGLITIDLDGDIILANRSSEQILDIGKKLVGRNVYDLIPELRELVERVHPKAGKIDRFEMNRMNSRDERVVLGFSVSPLLKEKVKTGYILIFQDLTQFKRFEKAMQRSEKLAAVGQLAAGIAHEIRNPLAGISGSLQLLRTTTHGEGSEEYRLMSIALREIDRLNKLITDFLDFVKPSDPVFDPLDINTLLVEVVEVVRLNTNLRPDIKTEIQFDLKLNCDRKILGSRDQLKQVFYNLVINACHAVEKTVSPKVEISTDYFHGSVMVVIKDNGSGMNEATLKRLFEPFYTTKPKGTGLGLATAHKILENHEASIVVESDVGSGTKFILEFIRLDARTQNTSMGLDSDGHLKVNQRRKKG